MNKKKKVKMTKQQVILVAKVVTVGWFFVSIVCVYFACVDLFFSKGG